MPILNLKMQRYWMDESLCKFCVFYISFGVKFFQALWSPLKLERILIQDIFQDNLAWRLLKMLPFANNVR